MGPARFIGDLFSRFARRFSPSPREGENADRWLGQHGERLAARHLRRNGYKVLYRNFRAPRGGEVDLVCRDKSCNTLVFVEVKTRSSLQYGSPAEAVNREKQKLITRGAMAWLKLLGMPDVLFRFDIVEVMVTDSGTTCEIIRDAFPLPEPYIY
jgi:putative endonuclease